MNTSIKIKLTINGKDIEMSLSEAEQLYKTLDAIFGQKQIQPITYPPYLPSDKDGSGWPQPPPPYITYCASRRDF